jgi:hypothetical protein
MNEAKIRIPIRILKRFIDAEEELFEWLLREDKDLIKRLERTRKRDLRGEFIQWKTVKKKLHIK